MCNTNVRPGYNQPSVKEAFEERLPPDWDVEGTDGTVIGIVGSDKPPTVNGKPFPGPVGPPIPGRKPEPFIE